jgi:hypothetical protein
VVEDECIGDPIRLNVQEFVLDIFRNLARCTTFLLRETRNDRRELTRVGREFEGNSKSWRI